MRYGLGYRCLTVVRMGTWREVPLFTDVRNRTRTRVFRRQREDQFCFSRCHTLIVPRELFARTPGLPLTKRKKVINGSSVKKTLPNDTAEQ